MAAPEVGLVGRAWSVNSEEELRAIVGDVSDMTRQKKKSALDQHTRRFIDASPYVCVATSDGVGRADVSPAATTGALSECSTTPPLSYPSDPAIG